MKQSTLPTKKTMYNAVLKRDSSYEGIFYIGVKTTGIFCRPTCRARKPKEKTLSIFPPQRKPLIMATGRARSADLWRNMVSHPNG